MTLPLRLLSGAEDDIAEAVSWYDERSYGLGQVFLLQIEECFAHVQDRPLTFAVVMKSVRRAVSKRFPYCVYFVCRDREIVIVAVLHGRRDPNIWKKRSVN